MPVLCSVLPVVISGHDVADTGYLPFDRRLIGTLTPLKGHPHVLAGIIHDRYCHHMQGVAANEQFRLVGTLQVCIGDIAQAGEGNQ